MKYWTPQLVMTNQELDDVLVKYNLHLGSLPKSEYLIKAHDIAKKMHDHIIMSVTADDSRVFISTKSGEAIHTIVYINATLEMITHPGYGLPPSGSGMGEWLYSEIDTDGRRFTQNILTSSMEIKVIFTNVSMILDRDTTGNEDVYRKIMEIRKR